MALGNSDSGRTVTLAAGDELDVTLSAIGNQGDPSVSSTAIQFEGSSVVGPANPGGPTLRYKFTAVRRGEAAITIPFLNPTNPPPFMLEVNVQ
jgi:predicted RNA-binding protein with TRAM domain